PTRRSSDLILLRPAVDDVVERVEAEILRVAELCAKQFVIDPTAQGPNRIDKRQACHLKPGCAQIPNLMWRRTAGEIDGWIADQENRVQIFRGVVAWERLEVGPKALLGQKHLQQVHAGEGRLIAENLFQFRQRRLVSEQDDLDLP